MDKYYNIIKFQNIPVLNFLIEMGSLLGRVALGVDQNFVLHKFFHHKMPLDCYKVFYELSLQHPLHIFYHKVHILSIH